MADQSFAPVGGDLAPDARQRVGRVWQRYGLEEHASVASFARFVMQAMQLGAPANLVRQAGQALIDEVHHAQLCFTLASRFLGSETSPGPFEQDICGAFPSSPEEVIAATIREGCVAETLAVEYAREALTIAKEPIVAQVLVEIVRDEDRHSELAWSFVAWALNEHPALRPRIAEIFDDVFDDITRDDAADTSAPGAVSGAPDGYGALSPAEERVIRGRMIEEVLRPRAHRLLAGIETSELRRIPAE